MTGISDPRSDGPATGLHAVGRTCRSCGALLETLFVDLGMSPLCERFLTAAQLDQMEPFYPLDVRICDACLLVQVPTYVSAEEIFGEYGYFSSFSDTWVEHARRFAESVIASLRLDEHSRVVEIASNDGYLLQHFIATGIPALGVEPARNIAHEAVARGIPTVAEFFGAGLAARLVAEGGPADLIVANNVFAHVPDLNDFIAGLVTLLKPGGTLTIEVQYLIRLIEGNQFDTIYHEHFMYYTVLSAQRALRRHGLRVFDAEELATHGGSIRLFVAHDDDPRTGSARLEAIRSREGEAGYDEASGYVGFGVRVAETKRALLEFLIGARRAGASVVGYGAPGKGNTLLNYCGIRTDFLEYTVDRNPYKQGRFLPGTHIPIHRPERIAETRPDYVLILPWNLRNEIIGQLAYVRGWGGRFVLPIPRLEVD